MTMNKHDEHCRSIAEELNKLANGEIVLIDGETAAMPKELIDDNCMPYWVINGKPCTYDGLAIEINGEEHETETIEDCSLWDWLEDSMYDVDFVIDSHKEYKACRIMIACGGPNIYINTWDQQIELYWWNESGSAWLPSETCRYIDAYMEEYFGA